MYTPLILNARIQFFELFNECAYPNVKELYLIHVYILLFIQIRIRKCYGDMKNIMLKLFCEPVVDMILKMLCQRCSSIICLGKYQKHHSYANKKDVTMGIPTFILFATYYLKCLRITVLPIWRASNLPGFTAVDSDYHPSYVILVCLQCLQISCVLGILKWLVGYAPFLIWLYSIALVDCTVTSWRKFHLNPFSWWFPLEWWQITWKK